MVFWSCKYGLPPADDLSLLFSITIWSSIWIGTRKARALAASTHTRTGKQLACLHGCMHAHEKMETTKLLLLLGLDNPS